MELRWILVAQVSLNARGEGVAPLEDRNCHINAGSTRKFIAPEGLRVFLNTATMAACRMSRYFLN
jgi:hypothetical protein